MRNTQIASIACWELAVGLLTLNCPPYQSAMVHEHLCGLTLHYRLLKCKEG